MIPLQEDVFAQQYQSIALGYQLGGVPESVVETAYEAAQSVLFQGVVLDYTTGKRQSHWIVGLVFGKYSVPDGYWQKKGTMPSQGAYMEFALTYIGMKLGYEITMPIKQNFSLALHGGLGLTAILGDIYATEVIPQCKGPIQHCGHWRSVTRRKVELANRLFPLLLAEASLQYDFSEAVFVRVGGGIQNFPYLGVTAGIGL